MAGENPRPGESAGQVNRLESHGGAGDVVQARDVHGGVHFHQSLVPFAVTPQQLPGPPQGFVNRDTELTYLAKLALERSDAPRILIITGTAGVGKTSLVLRCAHSVRDQFPDGQLYTNLRGYDPGTPATPDHVLAGFLRDLGVPAQAVPATLEDRAALYRSILADRRVLLVLDNAATVSQVRPLLPGVSGCLVMVTSRSRLAGLVAREGARRLYLDLLPQDDAIALLREVTAGYRTDDDADLAELARLCARLPLALRIAAERAAARPLMPLAELIADLRDESGLWDALTVNGDRDPEADADAVRTVFAWSYRALNEPAARLFRLLGLHPGNEFGLAAAGVLAGSDAAQTRRDLDALVGAHLVEQCGRDRYQFHDLLRAYAMDQVSRLETDQTRASARSRMLAWYLHTADAAQVRVAPFDSYHLSTPPPADVTPLTFNEYETALSWYRTEATNLVGAVRTAAETGEQGTAWRLAATMRGLYMHQNAFDDWITTARIGIDSAARVGDRAGEAENLLGLGMALFQARRLDEAEACHRRALEIRHGLGDQFGKAVSINALGLLSLRQRRLDEAVDHFRGGEQVFSALGERRWVALLRGNRAEALCERGDFPDAIRLAQDALVVARELDDRFGTGDVLLRLAWGQRGVGRLTQARASIEEALEIAEQDDNDVWRGHWLAELARIQLAQDQPGEALASSQRSAVIQRQLGDRSREAIAIDLTGQVYQRLDRPDEAAQFHHRAADVHRALGDHWQLAGALDRLATAVDRTGVPDRARRYRQEAVSLLNGFDDPVATAMRERLNQALAAR